MSYDNYYCMTGRTRQGNTGEYNYWPDRREGQYITQELNIPLYCPTQKLFYDSNLVGIDWEKIGRGEKKEREKEGKNPESLARLEPKLCHRTASP